MAPCRTVPGGQKLHFCLAPFCKNCNIFRTVCQIKLEICSLLNFRVPNNNLMVKRDECKWELCYYVSVRFWISQNCQKWSITNRILRIGHSWQSFNSFFENTYLWVAFGKSFIFCVFMLRYLFLVLKSTLKRRKFVIIMLWIFNWAF